jgi:3-isopropylmalate/(R)-2-methylmalate dehydratase small subunit
MAAAKKLRGKAWVFGDLLDVDWEIMSWATQRVLREKGIPLTEEELGKYCMTTVDPEFPKKVKKGDFIVAGENMGYGHDHDTACISIKGAGIAAVLCESTNGNFHRNSIHHGLPVSVCKGIKGKVKQGDELEVDLAEGAVKNITTGEELRFPPIPDFLLEMLAEGGLYPQLRKRIKEGMV